MSKLIDDNILSGPYEKKLPEIEKIATEIINKPNVTICKIGICGNYKTRFSRYKTHFNEHKNINPMAQLYWNAAIRPDYMVILYRDNDWKVVSKLEKVLIKKFENNSKNKNPGGEGSKRKTPPYHLYIVAQKKLISGIGMGIYKF